jgi:hypothetical protein
MMTLPPRPANGFARALSHGARVGCLMLLIILHAALAIAQSWSTAASEATMYPNCLDPDTSWTCQLLPEGLIYPAYLAGEKESRFRSVWAYERDDGWIWDITLGGRAGLWRHGTAGEWRPEGLQIDIEGAAMPRLDLDEESDLVSADFRFGIPVTYGTARYQTKMAYYHLSSHLGDEFLLSHPGYPRLNFSRDVLVHGHSFYATEWLRLYAEIGWAFASDVSEPWEFQFGAEYRPAWGTGWRGAPFAAVGTHLREEIDFGGNLVTQFGWAWRRSPASGLFRMGLQYYNGKSDQFSLFDRSESKIGLGMWYDY